MSRGTIAIGAGYLDFDDTSKVRVAQASGQGAVSIGTSSYTSGFGNTALGLYSFAGNTDTSVKDSDGKIGDVEADAAKYKRFATAVGSYTTATETGTFAGGYRSNASAEYATAIGTKATASGKNSVSIGLSTVASKDDAVAIGSQAAASESSSVALGSLANASANSAVAIGKRAQAQSLRSIAVGVSASTTGEDSLALGSNAQASKNRAIALGAVAQATGESAISIGDTSTASNKYSVALGLLAKATNEFSVALGSHSVTADPQETRSYTVDGKTYNFAGSPFGTVSIGGPNSDGNTYYRTITNVAAGRISETSTDAINGSQLFAAMEAIESTANIAKTNVSAAQASKVAAGKNVTVTSTAATATAPLTYTVNADAAKVAGEGSVSVVSSAKDADGVTTYTVKLSDTAQTAITNSGNAANKDLSNITPAGQSTVKALANDAVKVEKAEGSGITVQADSTTKPGTTTYKVGLDADTQAQLAKASFEETVTQGSNVTVKKTDSTATKGAEYTVSLNNNLNLGNAAKAASTKVAAGNNTAVTSTADGATGAVTYTVNADAAKVAGEGSVSVVSSAKDADGVTTYTVKLAEDAQTAINNAGNAANKDLSNITPAGQSTVKALANDAVKVAKAENSGITVEADSSTVQGTTTYKVGLDADTKEKLAKASLEESVAAGANISVTKKEATEIAGAEYTVSLNNTLNLGNAGSVTIGDTKVEAGGLTITDGPSVTKEGGINAGGKAITNVAAGTNAGDAVNYGQLTSTKADLEKAISDVKTVVSAGKTVVADGINTAVTTEPSESTGVTTYKVNADKTTVSTPTAAEGATAYLTVTASASTAENRTTDYAIDLSESAKASLANADNAANKDLGNLSDAGTNKIKEVAQTAVKVEKAENSGITVQADSTTVPGTTTYKVGLDAATQAQLEKAGLEESVTAGSNVTVTKTEATAEAGTDYKVSLNNNLDLGTTGSVQFGPSAEGATPSKLDASGLTLSGGNKLTNDGLTVGGTTITNADGVTTNKVSVTGGPTISNTGIAMGAGQKITGLAAGSEDADAVNYKQLKDLTGRVDTLTQNSTLGSLGFRGDKAGEGATSDTLTRNNGAVVDIVGGSGDKALSDGNIGVVVENDKLNVKLANDITLDKGSVTTTDDKGNTTVVKGDSISSSNSTIGQGTTLTSTGVTASDEKAGTTTNMTSGGLTASKADGPTTSVTNTGITITPANPSDGSAVPAEKVVTLTDAGLNNGGNRITNIAAGKDAGDAVNMGQVEGLIKGSIDKAGLATTDELNKAKASGLNFVGNDGQVIHKDLGATLSVVGDYNAADTQLVSGNVGVVNQDGKLVVQTAKDINLTEAGSISVGGMTISNEGINNGGRAVTMNDGFAVEGALVVRPETVDANGNTYAPIIDAQGNQITSVAPGYIGEGSTDAVNGGQLYETNKAVNAIGGSVAKLGNRINRVGAASAALAALHPLDFNPDDKWDFAAGYGNYRGANAAAVGAYYRPNEDTMFSVGGTFGGGENMVNAGVSFKLGQSSGVNNSKVALAKDVQALKEIVKAQSEQIQAQSAEIEQLKRGGNMGVAVPSAGTEANFSDLPQNHWAYSYVKSLADKGLLTGYPDGEFKGDRTLTRYEFAAALYRAIQNGAPMDRDMLKGIQEFNSEITLLSNLDHSRVDRVSGEDGDRHKVERVRINNEDDKVNEVFRDVYGGKIQKEQ
ncbi:YadA-like family protein [uncultured Veillonella sp.]|uniref:beta strand repeat-containing protein n=1 Tax=uncultured Veillonella sp. TaxID=159268 RepID=UPI003450B330